ncbi:serine hydrolase [Pedobacter nutrimenti]|uniref:CubicO group peptidase (Beta-lactamase class C family) n=1 Tax=Pedobacter nutrimenti TaxID=1241337 RepID=A0A318U8B1_9SPHI|nr:serine hydrolase [Pedobacter nutrimenti]PYF70705.1 CubicO group peptidase (beta-lactamase class C family) [Pedobacter nutrimenti]
MNAFTKMTLLFVGICFHALQSAAQIDKAAQIEKLIHNANHLGLFNGNVLIADQGKIIYKTAVGHADASGKVKLTGQYRFSIGSIAKEFNAVGIMLLKEQGKLSLEDPVSKYLPELPPWSSGIKIKNLLQYSSGLPKFQWNVIQNDADNMEHLKKTKQLDFEPGTQYSYNNNDVFLQRRIIEKISGQSFKEFAVQRLLKPAAMHTAIVDPGDKDPFIARSYDNQGKEDPLDYHLSGWVSVTTDDLYKWSNALNKFRLIGPLSTKELSQTFAWRTQCGLGSLTMENNKIISHKHDGSNSNYQALLLSTTENGRTVILMTNQMQNNLYALNNSIQAILDGKPYDQIKKSFGKSFRPQIEQLDGKQLLAFYHQIKKEHGEEYNFNEENELNEIGYKFLRGNKLADAILIFEYNTVLFPQSGNVFDSLGEAYYKQGDKVKALLNYQQSFRLDPANETAKKIIAELDH